MISYIQDLEEDIENVDSTKCCRTKEVPEKCLGFCFLASQKKLKISFGPCQKYKAIINNCDSTECCEIKGVPDKCLGFCFLLKQKEEDFRLGPCEKYRELIDHC